MSPISSKVYGGWHQTVPLPVFGSSWDASSSAQGQNRALTDWYWNTGICETDRISVISDPGCTANRWCCLLFRAIFRKCAATLRKYPIWKISIFENIIVVIIGCVAPIKIFHETQKYLIFHYFTRFWTIFGCFLVTKWWFSEIWSILPTLFAWGCIHIPTLLWNVHISNP